MTTADDLRNMKPLEVANDAVGDPAETFRRLDDDGYLYLRDVLDQGAIRRLKQKFVNVLIGWGFVDPGSEEPVWNGTDISNFPVKIEPLHEARVWEEFVAEPPIDAFFTKLLGTPPFWLEITEYRITPPCKTLPDDPFVGRHQDAFYNKGMDCLTCWVPLMEIDEDLGGLAIIPGLNKAGFFHDAEDPPQFPIPPSALPGGRWHRSHYRPGDLVVFHKMSPHSGLPNTTDRFRLSMDIRVAPRSGELPIIGRVTRFTREAITIRKPDGENVSLLINEDTYCRWTAGKQISVAELQSLIPVGDRILASASDGKAISLRPPR